MPSSRLDGDVVQLFPEHVMQGVIGVVSELVVEVSQQLFDGMDGGIGEGAFVDVGVGESHGVVGAHKMTIALRFHNGNIKPKKEGPLGPHLLFLPRTNAFSALLNLALTIASSLPGTSPGPVLNSSRQFIPH